jgi:hypothetical protein
VRRRRELCKSLMAWPRTATAAATATMRGVRGVHVVAVPGDRSRGHRRLGFVVAIQSEVDHIVGDRGRLACTRVGAAAQ